MEISISTYSAKETMQLGKTIGLALSSPVFIALSGDLGAGKTTFVQGLAKGLDVPEDYYITSPTYTIINEYPGRLNLCHMDLYRLDSLSELAYLGFDEIVSSNSVIVVEWPELLDTKRKFILFDLKIIFKTDEKFNRKINLIASGLEGINLLKELSLTEFYGNCVKEL